MKSIAKWFYQWLRRGNDVLAIVVCCLWVAGWFVNIRVSTPGSEIRFDARCLKYVEVHAYGDEQSDVQVFWLDSFMRRQIFEYYRAPWELSRGNLFHRGPGYWVLASFLIVYPFLIWPLGRLTHRIVKRKSADA